MTWNTNTLGTKTQLHLHGMKSMIHLFDRSMRCLQQLHRKLGGGFGVGEIGECIVTTCNDGTVVPLKIKASVVEGYWRASLCHQLVKCI